MSPEKQETKGTIPYNGPERRPPGQPDRRRSPRGGRRVTDALRRLSDFAYKLLTEPPQ